MSAPSAAEMLRAARALLEAQFGPASGAISIIIRDTGGKRLALSLPLESLADPEPETPMEQCILEALGSDTLRGEELCERSGYAWGGRFRSHLARMVRAGLIRSTPDGYSAIQSRD